MNEPTVIKRIYVAGAVTGRNYRRVYDEFAYAKAFLLSNGFDEVVNPCELVAPGTSWGDAMLILLPYLDVCNYIAFLPGYQRSNGAMCEYYYARGMENDGRMNAIIHLTLPEETKLETETLKKAI